MGLTIATKLAAAACRFTYDTLSEEARDVTKRLIVDALGCTLGGFDSPTGRIVRDYASQSRDSQECTLIGTARRTAISPAIIANQAMLRYLDYNDAMIRPIGPGLMAATHPSGTLPVGFALCESRRKGGRELIAGMVAGYEAMGLLLQAFRVSLESRGFHNGCVHAYGGAAMAGSILGLSREQLAHAMGIAGSLAVGLDILDAEGEEYTMTKNLADGMIAERGYVAAELASRGLTGPLGIVEGHKGFARVVLGDVDRFAWSEPTLASPLILQTFIKGMCADATTHGHLRATIGLAVDHDIRPAEVESIRIRTSQRAVHHTGDPIKRFPRNKETADHSSHFLTAMALVDRAIDPSIFRDDNYDDPQVHRLIERTTLEHGPEFDAQIPAAEVAITLADGRTLVRRVERSALAGDPRARMTDAALRAKFLECVGDAMTPARVDRLIEAVLRLEDVSDLSELLALAAVEGRH